MSRKNLSISAIALFTLAALVYLIVRLFPGGGSTPEVLLPSVQPSSSLTDGSPKPGDEGQRVEVSAATVQAVIRAIDRAASYSRELTAHTYWAGGGSSSTLSVSAKSGLLRVTEVSEHRTENILITGDTLYLWYDGGGGVFTGTAAADEVSRLQRMVSVDWVLTLPKERITDAGYMDLDGEPCVWLSYKTDYLGYTETVYISVKTGLLMGDDSWDGEALVFSLRSGQPDVSTPADADFAVPSPG